MEVVALRGKWMVKAGTNQMDDEMKHVGVMEGNKYTIKPKQHRSWLGRRLAISLPRIKVALMFSAMNLVE
jgi:hypothetical protein